MPNGGMLPCCALCKWAADPVRNGDTIQCQHHKITIRNAHFTFCSSLEHRDSNIRFGMKRATFNRIMIYAWIEIGYQDPRYPTLPMYHHEFVPLAAVTDYAGWSEEQIQEARQQLNQQVLDKLRSQTNPKQQNSDQSSIFCLTQFSRRMRNLLSRFRNRIK